MFRKRIQDLTAEDIQRVVAEQWEEGQDFELKAALQGHDIRNPGEQALTDKAKKELIDEVVAFANTSGGWLVVGIDETKDHPRRAYSLRPVPLCADLASRLDNVFAHQIEPPMPPIGVRGIKLDETGAGVIVINVSGSRLAPHRNKMNLECSRRSREKCEKMSMRDIQDLTLQSVNRGLRVEEHFQRSRQDAAVWHKHRFPRETAAGRPGTVPCLSTMLCRATFVARDLYTLRLHGHGQELLNGRSLSTVRGDPIDFGFRSSPQWRPIVRGTAAEWSMTGGHARMAIREEGSLEIFANRGFGSTGGPQKLWLEDVIGALVTGIDTCERLRGFAASDAEFEVEVELITDGEQRVWIGPDPYRESDRSQPVPPIVLQLPRYSLGSISEASALVSQALRDLWDGFGKDEHDHPSIAEFTFPAPSKGAGR
jgi:hypothetical protein